MSTTIEVNPFSGGGASPLTTKGDVYTHDATVDARLPVGADGFVLTADSTQATGLKWAAGTGSTNSFETIVTPSGTSPVADSPTDSLTLTTSAGMTITGTAGTDTIAFALDATLQSLAAFNTNGLLTQTAADTFTGRTITAGSSKVLVTDGDGVAGNPTVDVVEANLTLNNIGGTLGISKGGTGQTTAVAAFDALAPTTTKGDLIVHDGADNVRRAVGTDGQVLTADSAEATGVKWATPTGSTNSFETIATPAGTSPVADSATDTLTLSSSDGSITITGTAGTDTIDFVVVDSAIDHGSISGLGDDDHTQYALLAGRAGGQTLNGGTAAGDDLTLSSTANATKGSLLFGSSAYDEVNNRLGLLNTAPTTTLSIGATEQFRVNSSGNLTRVNDIAYSWPASQGGSTHVLTNDGAGNLTWAATSGGMAIGGSITSGTAGSVLFVDSGSVLAQDNANFFWDNTNNRLGLLTTAPTSTLSVGASNEFQVSSSGDMVKIKNITYAWPTVQSSGARFLRNDGTGTLSWETTSGSGMNIGGTVGSGTNGSVLFVASGNLAQDNANFFWDDTNNRLGIGTATPANPLDVRSAAGTQPVFIRGGGNAGVKPLTIQLNDTTEVLTLTDTGRLGIRSATPAAVIDARASSAATAGAFIRGGGNASVYPLQVQLNDATDVFTVIDTGRVGINTITPSARLDVRSGSAATVGAFIRGGGNSAVANLAVEDNGASSRLIVVDNKLGINQGSPTYTIEGLGATSANGLRIRAAGNGTALPLKIESGDSATAYMDIDAAGKVGLGNASPAYKLDISGSTSTSGLHVKSAGNGTAIPLLIEDSAAGTQFLSFGANNKFGVGTSSPDGAFQCTNIVGATTVVGVLRAAGSQSANILDIRNSGNTNLVSFDSSGNMNTTTTGIKIATATTQKIGFWNAAPVAQQTVTGSRVGGAALTNLLIALNTIGIIVDSTSA